VDTKATRQPVKYREVERSLRQGIASGVWKAGDRLPGEYDLAQRFSVSYLTVRQAVSHLVDDGTLLRVRGKGTFVVDRAAAEEERGTRRAMALLFPTNWQRRDPYYFPEILQGFQQAMEAHGHRAALLNDNIAEAPGALPAGCAVACLLIGDEHLQLVERLRDAGHPVLGVNRYTGRRSVPSVRIDDEGGVERAVDYLVSRGHTRISFLRGPAGNFDAASRLQGFRNAIRRHGLTVTAEAGDDFGEESGYEAARMLLGLPNRPTAIVCASDLSAIGAIGAATDLGLTVPRDLSVAGFGDFSVAHYVRPSLTTIRQCRVALGQTAAEMLIALANDEEVSNTLLDAELVLRESTDTCPIESMAVSVR
jgi:LacI family transcriptional regulator